jgi:hypothetical protein
MYSDHAIEHLDGHILYRCTAIGVAGVVHEDVDLTKFLERSLHHALDLRLYRNIRLHDKCFAPQGLDGFLNVPNLAFFSFVGVVQHKIGTFTREGFCHPSAYATG